MHIETTFKEPIVTTTNPVLRAPEAEVTPRRPKRQRSAKLVALLAKCPEHLFSVDAEKLLPLG